MGASRRRRLSLAARNGALCLNRRRLARAVAPRMSWVRAGRYSNSTKHRNNRGESASDSILFENIRDAQAVTAEQWKGNAVLTGILHCFSVRCDGRDGASRLIDNPEIPTAICQTKRSSLA